MALLSVKFKMKVSAENSKSCGKAFALAVLSFVARSSACCSCSLHFDLFCFPFAFHHGAPKIMMSPIKRRRLARVGFLPWPLTHSPTAQQTPQSEPNHSHPATKDYTLKKFSKRIPNYFIRNNFLLINNYHNF